MRRTREQGDALVIFGVTGDLAFKHTIPALQRMIQAGELEAPVVGVAREHWTVEKLDEQRSIRRCTGSPGRTAVPASTTTSASLRSRTSS